MVWSAASDWEWPGEDDEVVEGLWKEGGMRVERSQRALYG